MHISSVSRPVNMSNQDVSRSVSVLSVFCQCSVNVLSVFCQCSVVFVLSESPDTSLTGAFVSTGTIFKLASAYNEI